MKIAITGGTGFIGKWILKTIDQKTEVQIFGRNKDRKSFDVGGREYEYVYTDYSEEDLKKKLKGSDAVIHLAATRVGKSGFTPYLENISISQSLFEACKHNDIKNLVCLSSISVYSEANTLPWKESDYVAPLSFYGISKVAMENLAEYYNKKESMCIKNLRIARVVGHGERTGFMLMNFINQAFKKETLKVYGEGAGKREYIYVRDVVDAVLHSLKQTETKGVFNIGTGVNTSHYELAKAINKVFNNDDNLEFIKNVQEDKMIFLMDNQKTKNELGWNPKWNLEEGLKEIKDIMTLESGERR